MPIPEKTAVLVISFGTSYPETRKKTIEKIEKDIQQAFPDLPCYRAWTSPGSGPNLRNVTGPTSWILQKP